MNYTVGEMSRLLKIPASTLRYYDKEGLLPFVERSNGGIRMFQEKDYEWLQIISCLKQAGMSIKDIREYIRLAMEGDSTIDQRLALFERQREMLRLQMLELQKTMDTLDYKYWYYETAKAAGSTQIPQNMPLDELPEWFRRVRKNLKTISLPEDSQH
jgi:DNA-binding transcriptional MerR regulator